MSTWVDIVYRDFYDVPRLFAFRHQQAWYLCDCPFNDSLDEYPTNYEVYRLSGYAGTDPTSQWSRLKTTSEYVARVPVTALQFDPTRRRSADVGAILAPLEVAVKP